MSKKRIQKNAPFISDPSTLVFRDFVVGEEMHLPFTLTNVSISRNTFKVVGFDEEYRALFKINFSPPGYLSPGVGVNLSLDFTPKTNSPIVCALHCLAETGPFDITVECSPKTVNIQIDPFDHVDLGTVTLGEEREQSLVIRNSGALDAVWSISLDGSATDPGNLSLKEAEEGVIGFGSKHGTVSGYGSSTLRIIFRPNRPARIRFRLQIKFSSPKREFESFVREMPIEGIAADLPVFLESDVVDLGVCYYNELYRASLVAHNRSNVSQRFVILLPSEFEKYIEFTPKMGFIQPLSSLQITLKVRINSKFLLRFPQFGKTVVLPIAIEVVNQVLPINLSLTFTPSSLKLNFEPETLNFGTILTSECKRLPLRITSNMELPCDFGFVRLPNGVSIEPFDGFGLIMPGETTEVYVSFQSQVVKKHTFQITVATLQGQMFTVDCIGNVISSPLEIDATTIEFRSTPLGQETSHKILIRNIKPVPVDIEMEKVEEFIVDPMVATIPANSTLGVLITFKPDVPIQQAERQPDEEQSTSAKKDAKKDAKKHQKAHTGKDKKKAEEPETIEEVREIISSDFTYRLYEKSLACFYRQGSSIGRHHIMLKAAAVLPTMYVTAVTVNKVEKRSDDYIDLSLNSIDFGVVCIGQHIDAIVELKSVVRRKLNLDYIFERGSFEVLSPVTTIKPLQTTQVKIRFSPNVSMKFSSKIQIVCPERPNTRVELNLTGSGSAANIDLPLDSCDFGHVLVGHTITKTIKVKNNAEFALEYLYELRPVEHMHCKNISGTDAFHLVTKKQWLRPQEFGDISISFSPDHDNRNFETVLVISAGDAGESREVQITAAAWPHVMFIMGGSEEPQQRTRFDHYLLDEPYFRSNVLCEMSYPGTGSQTVLTFGVCHCQNDEGKKTNGDLAFDAIPAVGFTVNPPKAVIESGGVTRVTVEYTPPNQSVLPVGQWVVADTAVTIKCADFTRKVPVRLKCLIHLQQQQTDANQSTINRQSKVTTAKRKKMFLCILSLPGLNRAHCDDMNNGYSCEDLENGVKELEAILETPRKKRVMVYGGAMSLAENIFLRLTTVVLALATDSTPLLVADEKFSKPDFAQLAPKPTKFEQIDFCFNETNLSKDTVIYETAFNPSFLLFNPAFNRVYDRLGKAALHILIHFTLNFSSWPNSRNGTIIWGNVNTNIQGMPHLDNKLTLDQLKEVAVKDEIVEQLPNFPGFIENLIRGRSPILCDRVGNACWKAKSYLAGGINPIYPGIGRSSFDISRSNIACSETKYTQRLLEKLI